MSRPGLSRTVVDHLLRVSMVRADEHLAAHFLQRLHSASHTAVHGLDGLHRRRDHARMAYHIRVREIDDNHIVFICLDGLHQTVAHLGSAHLGLQVVGRHLRGFHQDAVLALVRLLYAAVEEEGHMGVLLRLSQAKLGQAMGSQVLSKSIVKLYLVEGYQLVRDGRIVLRKAYVGQIQLLLPREVRELVAAEGSGDLSGPVRTEIKEDHGIAVLDGGQRLSILHHHCRNHELVRHVLLIGSGDGAHTVGSLHALTLRQGLVGQLHAVPAVVAVHSVIASHHGSHFADADLFHLIGKLLHKILSGGRRGIAAVQEAVYIDLLQAMALRQLQKAVDVRIVAVHAAVGHQSEHVEGGILRLRVLHSGDQGLVLKEVPVLNLLGDAGQLLVYDAPRAHIHMAYLGISHLSVGKSHSQSACVALYKGIFFHQLIHHRGSRHGDGVALRVLIQAVAVQDHQYCRFLTHCSSPPLQSLLSSSGSCSSGCFRTRRSRRPR